METKLMKLAALVILATPIGMAQTTPIKLAPWTPPKTIKEYCVETETNILNTHYVMEQLKRTAIEKEDLDDTARQKGMKDSDSYRSILKDIEETWQRLGCAQILYPPGSTRP